jgi:apolipoprotein N-acyltransferase
MLSGGLLFCCFPLLGWHFLAWIALIPLLLAIQNDPRPKVGFWMGYVTGFVFLATSCHWFTDVMELHGGLSPVLAWGVLALFAMLFAVFMGAFGAFVSWVAMRSESLALILAPFMWVVTELGRTYLFTGVPWNLLGYAVQFDGLRRIAALTGVYGLSFLAVATSAMLAWALPKLQFRLGARVAVAAWPAALLLLNCLLAPPLVVPGSRAAHLVQPNIPMEPAEIAKWAPWIDPGPLNRLVDKSIASARAEGSTGAKPFIIWPENPAPFYFERDPIFRAAAERMARESGAYAVVGSVNFADAAQMQPKNSAVVLDPAGRALLAYDKLHLVPFGEYVPAWAFPDLVGKITHEAGNFVPGSSYHAAKTPEGSLSLFICYESIFPQLVRRLVPEGPAVLVNISNDAWFGDTAAGAQHLEMARLRAIENRRYLLRATNDGITCIIDPYGRVLERLPRHQSAILSGKFDFVVGSTIYTRYGDVFAWANAAVVLMAIAWLYWREGQTKRQTAKGKSQN